MKKTITQLFYLATLGLSFTACELIDEETAEQLLDRLNDTALFDLDGESDYVATSSTSDFTLGASGDLDIETALEIDSGMIAEILYDEDNYQVSKIASYNKDSGKLSLEAPERHEGAGTYNSWEVFIYADDMDYDEDGNYEDEYQEATLSEAVSSTISSYVAANYPDAKVLKVWQDDDELIVELDNDTYLVFDSEGNFLEAGNEDDWDDYDEWDDEDEYQEATLSEAVSSTISSYVATNYPDAKVLKVWQDDDELIVELDNGTYLIFDSEGNFLEAGSEDDWDYGDEWGDDYQEVTLSEAVSTTINTYIASNHSEAKILEIWQEENLIIVALDNDVYVAFDQNGTFIGASMESNGDESIALSDALMAKINNYVTANYPNTTIDEIGLEYDAIVIELSNDVVLLFDLEGNFLKVEN